VNAAVTQCPHCQAKFRVRPEQARAHAGLVRCGACRGVFDARLNLVEGNLGNDLDDDEAAGGPQTILAGVPPVARTPSDEEVRAAAREAIAKPVAARDAGTRAATVGKERAQSMPSEDNADYDWRAPTQPLTRKQMFGYALLCLVALAALVAQSAYWFRDDLASRFPALSPTLSAACAQIGCRVTPPKRAEMLGFVGADLAADPAHRGLHVFTATLRNSSSRSVAFPSLILTFEGSNGEPLARRIFSPEQYAPANASLSRGMDGGTDLEVKLYLDVSPASPVGFKADHAYL
jgi:predicted Zn finger-like uncharacterized protein